MSTIPLGLRRLIGLFYLLLVALGVFFPISAQDTPTQSPPIAEESLIPEATPDQSTVTEAVPPEITPPEGETIVIETPPSPELTPEVTSEPVELVTPEATLEITAVPTPEVTSEVTAGPVEATSEATAEPVISPTEAVNIPPAFDLAQTAYDAAPGMPLLIELSVADDTGIVRLVEDVSATLGGLSLETQAPQETAAPFITRVRVIYLPPADYLGMDSFGLRAIDAAGEEAAVTIQINIVLLPEATPEVTAKATLEITPEVTPETTAEPANEDPLAVGVFVVNSTGDAPDANAADGICQTATADECTLRAAIVTANTRPGADTIRFNIPGGGVHTIQPSSDLPTITDSVVIDGYSQPGSAPATNSAPATLRIVLDGVNNAGPIQLGLRITASNSLIKGLVIHRSRSDGIAIVGGSASGNIIQGNYIGTDASGSADLGNLYGIAINNAPNNLVGGTTAGARNLISGNNSIGITIDNITASGNRIQGNYIGTDASGSADLGNLYGIAINNAPGNTIGGITSGARNLISGNEGVGVFIDGVDATGNHVQGNYIGTDASGSAGLGNYYGVYIDSAPGNLVGGTTAAARNIIAGSFDTGVLIYGSGASGNLIQGNYIGTDAAGRNTLGNFNGVTVQEAAHITIGGTAPRARNLISGNFGNGIYISSYAYDVVVAGNFIGTDAAGKAALGNGGSGLEVRSATGITIGGSASGAGNRIAYNGLDGVRVIEDSATARILGNSISSNGGLGINVNNDGVTANDNGDVDTGPNGLQNFPVVTSVSGRTVLGYLDSESNRNYRLEFFASQTCDSSGNGEGERFLGRGVVTTDEMGNTPFNLTLGSSVPSGWFVTATATSLSGLTSEFSPCQIAPTAVPGRPTPTSPANNAKITGNVVTLSWRAVPNATAYHLEVAYDDGFRSVWTTDNTDLTSASFYGLPRSEAYYWRVRALDGGGVGGAWSQTRKFEILP